MSVMRESTPTCVLTFCKLCGRPPQYVPGPCKLTFELLTLKVVSESRVMWATSVPILVFLGLSVLDLGPMYATDVRRASSLNASALWGRGIIISRKEVWHATESRYEGKMLLSRYQAVHGAIANWCHYDMATANTIVVDYFIHQITDNNEQLKYTTCGGLPVKHTLV